MNISKSKLAVTFMTFMTFMTVTSYAATTANDLSSHIPTQASDGGIALMGTRIVYDADSVHASINIRNRSTKDKFLVQSWVENEKGDKSSDFFVAPPIYVSQPETQNSVNIKFIGESSKLPTDRESLYYFVEKTIPSIDKEKILGKDTVLVAVATKIKLFYRPSGLKASQSQANEMLNVLSENGDVKLKNASPYYLTLVSVNINGKKVKDFMVAPFSTYDTGIKKSVNSSQVKYYLLNDFGSKVGPFEKESGIGP